MGKTLRVFTILLLILSIGALILGVLLFNKRELLKGRTQMLEEYVIKLGSTLETEKAEALEELPGDPERDVGPVTDQVVDDPEIASFWDTYKYHLEETEQGLLDLNKKRREMMQYFQLDPITQKPKKDQYGQKIIKGEGTMHAVLEDALLKAEDQYNLLNETREQLRVLREELISTIRDLNSQKGELRQKLQQITQLSQQIMGLAQQVEGLRNDIALLEEEKQALRDDVAERDRQIQLRDKDIAEQKTAIKRLEQIIDDMKTRMLDTGPGMAVDASAIAFIEPGDKGKIIAVNKEWNFAIIKVTPAFINEIWGEDPTRALPHIELVARRADSGDFVTKLKITQVKLDEGLAVADILTSWQQMPLKIGDVVFH
jgi:hypothetical protein